MTARWLQKALGAITHGALLFQLASGCGGERFSTLTASGGASNGGRSGTSGANVGRSGGGSSGTSSTQGGVSEAGRANGGGGAAGSSAGTAGRTSGSGGGANGGTAAVGGVLALGGGGVGVGGLLNRAGAGAAPIPTNELSLWLDAERGVIELSGSVLQWDDQSGNAANATQALASARPRRVSASGGLSMIEFDGMGDFFSLPAGFADFAQGVSFFAVVEVAEERACAGILELSNGAEIDDIDFGRQGEAPHYEVLGEYFHGPEGAFELEERWIVGVVHDTAGNAELRLDGVFQDVRSFPLPTNVVRHDNFVGRSLYAGCPTLGGSIGEIILYSRAMAAPERVRVEQYLADKWQ